MSDDGPSGDEKSSGGGGGGTADLMAAIREAKNKKLRKVAETVVDETKKAKPVAKSEPMDMMSALKARVEMRRKAMLGKHTVEKKEDPVSDTPKLDGGGDEPEANLPPGARRSKAPASMSNVVLAAMVDSHKQKENEEGDEWET
jgi:hypothetical protein